VRQIVDDSGNVTLAESYEPYGSVLSSTGTASSIFAYAGEQIDTTGLIYLRARYMQPRLGIFLARDPWSGDQMQPGSMNGWGYVEGNPINKSDPSGRVPTSEGIMQGHYSFSCQCGWIDWQHAIPTNARKLIKAVRAQVDAGAGNYKAVYAEEYGDLHLGVEGFAIVRKDLSRSKQDAVALGIFMEVSERFEDFQSVLGSSYSIEDLPSNLIGFYLALGSVEEGAITRKQQYARIKPMCGALENSLEDLFWSLGVLDIYDKSGMLNEKNHEWHPGSATGGGIIDNGISLPLLEQLGLGQSCFGGCKDVDRQWPAELSILENSAIRSRRDGEWWWWEPIDGGDPYSGDHNTGTFRSTSTPGAYSFHSPNYP
jgi:RHS repeat-associated protein